MRTGRVDVRRNADGQAVLGHLLQVVAQRDHGTHGAPRFEIPVPAGLVLSLQGREIGMRRGEERGARTEDARTAVRPVHAERTRFGIDRLPPHLRATARVGEYRPLQGDHHPETQPPLTGARRPPAHAGGVGPDLLEPQTEPSTLVRDGQIDVRSVQGPRSEPNPLARRESGERAGARGEGAHVGPQARRQVHQRARVVHVPGIEASPWVDRCRCGFIRRRRRRAFMVRHDAPRPGAATRREPPQWSRRPPVRRSAAGPIRG